jgi:hypothetical protein
MGAHSSNLFSSLPDSGRLVTSNLEKVWTHYDKNHDNSLSEAEFKGERARPGRVAVLNVVLCAVLVKDVLESMKK